MPPAKIQSDRTVNSGFADESFKPQNFGDAGAMHASAFQKGKAAELRNNGRQSPATINKLNAIIHSGDVTGKYAHVPNEIRNDFHKHLIRLLKPGGVVLFEAFSKEQLNYSSGGPKDYDMLFSEKEIKTEFSSLQFTQLETLEIDLNEGKYHQGRASVVRFKATKL
mgnify:CR=1 FL=1